ncbi:MAG: type IV toxin-antitoxin system AbiEi family antitoxin domain-containing protein, partial [Arachnia sp.]
MQPDLNTLFTHAQLVAGGLHPNEIRSKLRSGELTRIRRGVYRTGGAVDPIVGHHQLVWAMLLHVDATNVVSHQSAAVLHGLPTPREDLSRVRMTRRTSGHTHSTQQLRVHNAPLDGVDVTFLDEVPVTSLARTTSDLARTLPYGWGVAVCDAALRMGLHREEMLDALNRYPQLRGQGRARQVATFADPLSESPAESMSRVAMARAGIPVPQLQYEIIDNN